MITSKLKMAQVSSNHFITYDVVLIRFGIDQFA